MESASKTHLNYLRHSLFWLGIWLFYVFFFSYNATRIGYAVGFASVLVPITTLPTYLMVKVVMPKYLKPKKYVLFGVYSLSVFLLTTLLILLLLFLSVSFEGFGFQDLPPLGRNFVYLIILVYLIVTLVCFEHLWRENGQISKHNKDLETLLLTEKLHVKEQELEYLKNQIHPHFLFNALNTIYGLALKESDKTPTTILKLSGLLDYILYQTHKSTVALEEEITHLEQYIAMEKIRFQDSLKVSFSKTIDNPKLQLAPLLLLPFVENAFKHSRSHDGILNVSIQTTLIDKVLTFNIKNTTTETRDIKQGIGLKNVKERLDILYPNRHTLKIDIEPNWFVVCLEINL